MRRILFCTLLLALLSACAVPTLETGMFAGNPAEVVNVPLSDGRVAHFLTECADDDGPGPDIVKCEPKGLKIPLPEGAKESNYHETFDDGTTLQVYLSPTSLPADPVSAYGKFCRKENCFFVLPVSYDPPSVAEGVKRMVGMLWYGPVLGWDTAAHVVNAFFEQVHIDNLLEKLTVPPPESNP